MSAECPACDARQTLEPVGHGWQWCSCCAACVLFDAERVVKIIHAKRVH
ncbi:MAG TPA: hypothetical protein VNJ04_12150 [Gemmatimonadaceae bacterium]|nr:hypothetical protein [Gemmatimonadaceae bacterium]